MDALVLSSGLDDALREENWKLKQFLRGSESTQRRLERQNRALQRRIQQLEAQLTTRQPRVRESSTKSEREWMVEHDNNVRALLHIIRHHEAAKEVLQREVQHLRAKEAAVDAVVKVSRSAQTDRSHGRWCMVSGEGDQETHTQADACIKVRASSSRLSHSFPHVTNSSVCYSTCEINCSKYQRLRPGVVPQQAKSY
jgi:chromosome segregation ATPase